MKVATQLLVRGFTFPCSICSFPRAISASSISVRPSARPWFTPAWSAIEPEPPQRSLEVRYASSRFFADDEATARASVASPCLSSTSTRRSSKCRRRSFGLRTRRTVVYSPEHEVTQQAGPMLHGAPLDRERHYGCYQQRDGHHDHVPAG